MKSQKTQKGQSLPMSGNYTPICFHLHRKEGHNLQQTEEEQKFNLITTIWVRS